MSEGEVTASPSRQIIVRWPRLSFYITLGLAFILDQLTKAWAIASLKPVVEVQLIPRFFDLHFVQNGGVAFGMFAGQGMLIALMVIALGLLALYFTRGVNWSGWEPNLVGGCLVGGAIGNLVDRFRFGYVVDFFDVHLGPHHWPVFNVADSFICVAVTWIVIRQLTAKS